MKKLLVLFLLAFPILIFAIINISATIIGRNIPIPVEKVEVSLDTDIWSNEVNLRETDLSEGMKEINVYFRVLPSNARNHKVKTYSTDPFTSDIVIQEIDNTEESSGIRLAKVKLYEFGGNEIHITTEDGHYEAIIRVFVQNPDDDPNLIKSVFFDYKEALHGHYQFGYLNSVRMDFRYFPEEAHLNNTNEIFDQLTTEFEGEVLEKHIIEPGKGYFVIKFKDEEKQQVFGVKTLENRITKFTFNVNRGYNIKGHNFDEIQVFTKSGEKVYQLEEIDLPRALTISNGTYYDGNMFKITHKNIIDGSAVNVTGNNTTLNQVHIVGPLFDVDGQILPSQDVVNLRLTGSDTARTQTITNSIIENARYNVTLIGKSFHNGIELTPTEFYLENVKFSGALLGGLNIDNQKEGALMVNSTLVRVKNLSFEFVGVGILLQNSKIADGQKGYSKLVVLPSIGLEHINSLDTSKNWRNLDEASGLLKEQNVLSLLDELKKYDNVIYRKGRYYYVSPVIMIRGGAVNHSQIYLDEKTESDLIKEERTPSTMEAMHTAIGGRYPFTVYLLNPKYFPRGDESETN
ncbi:MAG: hypothetical protein ACOX56_04665 [Acholeplasmataceae bacterium]|jgi:hypothetical protein